MADDYGKRVTNHHEAVASTLWQLMVIAQKLCPSGEWVFQLFATTEYQGKDNQPKNAFMACYTNGDDNVTAICDTPGAAVAMLISRALDGAVFPLTGNGGVKYFPGDVGWIREQQKDEKGD